MDDPYRGLRGMLPQAARPSWVKWVSKGHAAADVPSTEAPAPAVQKAKRRNKRKEGKKLSPARRLLEALRAKK